MAKILLLSMVAATPAAADDDLANNNYHFGDGLHLFDSNWMMGGYSSASFNNLQQEPARVDLDHLSMFLWWEGEQRWKFFSELDYENVVASRPSSREGEDRYLALERLYVDYAVTDSTTLRVGKFLTPIGRWNEIHAAPLVWTTSRPILTEVVFPGNVTGLMMSGRLPGAADGVEFSVYGSNTNDLRANPEQDPFYEAVGLHLKAPLGRDAQIGFSYSNFEQRQSREERKQLIGLDYVWTFNRYELSSEGIYRFSELGHAWDERGAFVQLAIPLTQRLFAVERIEMLRQSQQDSTTQLWVTGVNFRLTGAVVFKLEWIGAKHNTVDAPEGLMSSVSLMF